MNLLKLSKSLKYKDYQGFEETLKSIELLSIDNLVKSSSKNVLEHTFAKALFNNDSISNYHNSDEFQTNLKRGKLGVGDNIIFKTDGSLKSLCFLYSLYFKNKYSETYRASVNAQSLFYRLSPLKYYMNYRPTELLGQLNDIFKDFKAIDFSSNENIQNNFVQTVFRSTISLYQELNELQEKKTLKEEHAQIIEGLRTIIENSIKNIPFINNDKKLLYAPIANFYRQLFEEKKFQMNYFVEERQKLEQHPLYKFFYYKESPICNKINSMNLNQFTEFGVLIALAIPAYTMNMINKKQKEKIDIVMKKKLEGAYQLSQADMSYAYVLPFLNTFSKEVQDKLLSIVDKAINNDTVKNIMKQNGLSLKPEIEIMMSKKVLEEIVVPCVSEKKRVIKL